METASTLLERITAEKAELVKNQKIKSHKPLTPINDKEKPFELPKEWIWCPLGDIANGFQYGTSSKSLAVGKIPVLRMGNIQSGEVSWDGLVFSNDDDEIEKYKVEDGDLLFNRTNSRELVGKTALFRGDRQSIFAGYLVRFRMALDICPEYANFVMNSILHNEWCNEVKTDALGQSNINATKLRMFRFPLPPSLEQSIIVAKVKKLLVLCDQLEVEIANNQSHAKQLMQAVLKEAFSQSGSVFAESKKEAVYA
jgi:type I restriction enzyme S subunit